MEDPILSNGLDMASEQKSFRFTFTLNPDSIVDVDWKCKHGGNFYDVLQKLEALHSGVSLSYEYGYEDDGFIAPEGECDIGMAEMSRDACDATFYVNSGNIENRRTHPCHISEDDTCSLESDDERSPKRAKHSEDDDSHILAPEVEECIRDLERAWNIDYADMTKTRPNRFPVDLEPFLLRVAQTAMNNNRNKYITKQVAGRVGDITGFAISRLKPRMKELVKRSEHAKSTSNSTNSNSTEPASNVARNVVQKVKEDIRHIIEHSHDPEIALLNMKNSRMEKLKEDLSQMGFDELVWNHSIRMTVIELSFIEDTLIEYNQASYNNATQLRMIKSALYTDLSGLWPDGKMNKNKLKAMVSSARNKIKRIDDTLSNNTSSSSNSQTTGKTPTCPIITPPSPPNTTSNSPTNQSNQTVNGSSSPS